MRKSITVQPKTIVEMKMVQKRPDGSVVPMFNENKLGLFVYKIFGSCPEIFPFGMFKSHKLITNK